MAPQSAESGRSRLFRASLASLAIAASDGAGDTSLIAGTSEHARHLRAEAAFCARLPCHIVLHGETGTGKDLFIDELRRHLPASTPILVVPAGNLVDDLAAGQLFGHRAGAFTGAAGDADGFARLSNGGILVLNDADDIPPAVQQLLLPIAEGREFWPLGATRAVRPRIRLITVLHRPVADLVKERRIRDDLGFRISSGTEIALRPLRERKSDIPALANRLVKRVSNDFGISTPTISGRLLNALQEREYPGNIRELESLLRRASLAFMKSGSNGELGSEHLEQTASLSRPLYRTCRDLDVSTIQGALDQSGSVAAAAALLGVAKRSLWRRMTALAMAQSGACH